MLTEIIAGAAAVCIVILVYSYFVMQPKQRELTERARINAARYSGGSQQASGEGDLVSTLIAKFVTPEMIQGLLQKKE